MFAMLSLLDPSERQQYQKMPTHRFVRAIAETAVRHAAHRAIQLRSVIGFVGVWKDNARRDTDELRDRIRSIPRLPERLWVRLESIAARYGHPTGRFDSYARSLGKVSAQTFGDLMAALLSQEPDKSLTRLLSKHNGHIEGMQLASFSETAFLVRPDLYGPFNKKSFAEPLHRLLFRDNYEHYPAVCQALRQLCDAQRFPTPSRFQFLDACLQSGSARVAEAVKTHLDFDELSRKTAILTPATATNGAAATTEGKRRLRTHLVRERKGRSAYLRILQMELGSLPTTCDICRKDASDVYGVNFAPPLQIHHKDPIASGYRNTEAGDLVLLCANCHAACHIWLAIETSKHQRPRTSRRAKARSLYDICRREMNSVMA